MSSRFRNLSKQAVTVLLSIVVVFTMMPSLGLFGMEKSSAADPTPVVVGTSNNLVNIEEIGNSGFCEIIDFNFVAGKSPTAIEIPASIDGLTVRKIADGAFSGCGLTYVKFSDDSTIVELGKNAFAGNSITKFEANGNSNQNSLPVSVSTIGTGCFKNNALQSIYLKDVALAVIPDEAFLNSSLSGGITLPDALTEIGYHAFYNCSCRTFKIPANVTSIGQGALGGGHVVDCTEHEPDSIDGAPWFASTVKWKDTNGQDATYNTPFLFDKELGIIYGLKEDVATTDYPGWNHETGELTIPATIESRAVVKLACGAFSKKGNDPDYVKSVTFAEGSSLTKIPDHCFWQQAGITNFNNVPKTISSIGLNGMRNMSSLKSVTLPGVKTLGTAALGYNPSLKEVTLSSSAIETLANDAFFRDTALEKINILNMDKGTVKGAPWSAEYATIYWKNNDTTEPKYETAMSTDSDWKVTLSGTVLKYLGSERDLVIPSTISVVGQSNPVKITAVGDGADNILTGNENISTLNSVKFSPGIRTTNRWSLRKLGLTFVDLGELEYIGEGTFASADGVITNLGSSLSIPDTVTGISDQAFGYCGITGRLDISKNTTGISRNAFIGNPGITSVHLQMYRSTESDELYPKAPAALVSNAPWGASSAANQIYFMDEPQLAAKSEVTSDATSNTVKIQYRGFTNNNFYTVKNMVAASGMPELKNANYPGNQGMRKPATADMTVESTTKTVSGKQIKGGNGEYRVNMTFGQALGDNNTGNKTEAYNVTVDKFHILTYDANNGTKELRGSAPTAPEPYVAGHTPSLVGAGDMSIDGYTFKGWTANKNGANPVHAAGSKDWQMPDSDATLYAKWDANTYKVEFDGNGGTFGTAATKEINGKTDQDFTDLSGYAVPEKEGYVFQGWSKQSGEDNAVNISSVPAENTTVYAVWKAGTGISVTFNANGGAISGQPTKICTGTVDTDLTSMSGYQAPTRTGYTFKGWATTNNATAANITKVPTKSGVVFAVWQVNTFDLVFNANGGTFGTSSFNNIRGDYGVEYTEIAGYKEPTREGYNFRGWATSPGLTSANITSVPAKPQPVYAVWHIKNDIKVTFDPNGGKFPEAGENPITEEQATFGTKFDSLFMYEEPELQYYTFKGWATTDDAAAPNAATVPAANTTVYAVWEETPATDAEKQAFAAEIEAVKKDAEETKVSTDGKDVSEKDNWVPKEEKDKIDKAASDAEEVLNADGVTGKQIAEGSEALKASKDAFDKAKQAGTKEATDANNAARDALQKSIAAAEAKIAGKEADKYSKASVDALKSAITRAKALAASPTATTKELTDEKTALDNAASNLKPNDDPKSIPTEVTPTTPATVAAVTKAITTAKNDGDLKGSTYAPLKFQSKKQTKKSIKLQWSKVKGAKKYTIYANQCGKKNKYKKLATVKGKTLNVKKVAGKKLKAGASYKFLIIAENGDKVSAISKTLHIRTAGSKKYGNYTSVSVKKNVMTKAKKLKRGKTLKLNAKGVAPKGKKVSVHVKMRYESSNKKIATVTKAGKVKGMKKGKAQIYCYAQNGIAKVVTVTIK